MNEMRPPSAPAPSLRLQRAYSPWQAGASARRKPSAERYCATGVSLPRLQRVPARGGAARSRRHPGERPPRRRPVRTQPRLRRHGRGHRGIRRQAAGCSRARFPSAHEAAVLRQLATAEPRLAPSLPTPLLYDPVRRVLVCSLVGNGLDLSAYHARGRFPPMLARAVGTTLALLHGLGPEAVDKLPAARDARPPRNPAPLELVLGMSDAGVRLLGVLQRSSELCDRLAELDRLPESVGGRPRGHAPEQLRGVPAPWRAAAHADRARRLGERRRRGPARRPRGSPGRIPARLALVDVDARRSRPRPHGTSCAASAARDAAGDPRVLARRH